MAYDNRIQVHRSTTALATPASLLAGEIAVNITDKILYVGDGTTNIQMSGRASTSTASQIQYSNSSGLLESSSKLQFTRVATLNTLNLNDAIYFEHTDGAGAAYITRVGNSGKSLVITQASAGSIYIGDNSAKGAAGSGSGIVVADGAITINGPTTISADGVSSGNISSDGSIGGVSISGFINPSIGDASNAPIVLTSGTNLTTAVGGAIEYDGKVIYGSTGTGRGAIAIQMISIATSVKALTNGTAAQSIFASTSDIISLAASTTYRFEAEYKITTGTTSRLISIGFATTGATAPTMFFTTLATSLATGSSAVRTQDSNHFITPAGGNAVSSSSVTYTTISVRGVIITSTSCTVNPQLTFSAAPGGTNQTEIGSYIILTPVGSNTVASVGPWA